MAGINVIYQQQVQLVINGDVTMKGRRRLGCIAIQKQRVCQVAGIKAASGTMGQLGATVDINSKVDLAVDGVGLTEKGRSELKAAIKVNTESGQNTNYAIAVVGGAVDMNMENGKGRQRGQMCRQPVDPRSGIMGLQVQQLSGIEYGKFGVAPGVIIDEGGKWQYNEIWCWPMGAVDQRRSECD